MIILRLEFRICNLILKRIQNVLCSFALDAPFLSRSSLCFVCMALSGIPQGGGFIMRIHAGLSAQEMINSNIAQKNKLGRQKKASLCKY